MKKETTMSQRVRTGLVALLLGLGCVDLVAGEQYPIEPLRITNGFSAFNTVEGTLSHRFHTGLDLGRDKTVAIGTQLVRPISSGRVVFVVGLADGTEAREVFQLWNDDDLDGMVQASEIRAEETARELSNHGLGMSVIVEHSKGIYSQYSHLHAISKTIVDRVVGQGLPFPVTEDTPLGILGGSSFATWKNAFVPHLHLETKFLSNPGGGVLASDEVLGSPLADGTRRYYGYAPDLVKGYGYSDPTRSILGTSEEIDLDSIPLRVIAEEGSISDEECSSEHPERGVRIYSGPGTEYAVEGWTGLNTLLVADAVALSRAESDVQAGRLWFRIFSPGRLAWAYGWVSSRSRDNTNLLAVESSAEILRVSSADGEPLHRAPDSNCPSTSAQCIRIWDKAQPAYRVELAHEGLEVVETDQVTVDRNLWHQVSLPRLYFDDPRTTTRCAPNDNGNVDAAVGDFWLEGQGARAWLPGEALEDIDSSAGVDALLLSTTPSSGTVGSELELRYASLSLGPEVAESVRLIVELPTELEFSSLDNASCSYDPSRHEVGCFLGDQPAGASRELGLVVIPLSRGEVDVVAQVQTASADRDPLNNEVRSSIPIDQEIGGPETKLRPSDGSSFGSFGFSVSLSEETALISASRDLNDGAVYVFEPDSDGRWQELQKALYSVPGGGFGWSIDRDGDEVAAGAPFTNDGVFMDSGSMAFLQRDASGTWSEILALKPSDPGGSAQYGWSVGLSGDRAIVGVPRDDIGEQDTGAVVFLDREGDGSWTQTVVTASDAMEDDWLGWAVDVDGDVAAATAISRRNFVLIFEHDGNGWTEAVKFDVPGPLSVSVDSGTVFVGATEDDENGQDAGAIYVYGRDENGTWAEEQKLLATNGGEFHYLGRSIFAKDDRLIVGAEFGGVDFAGSAHVFERIGDGSWAELYELRASDGLSGDGFGISVSIHGDMALVGAWNDEDDHLIDSGSAYLFDLTQVEPLDLDSKKGSQ